MSDGKVSDWLEDEATAVGGASRRGGEDRPAGDGQGEEDRVEDRPSVLMYLPEELIADLEAATAELNRLSRRQRGRKVGKNRELYPALLRVALERLEAVSEEIGLEAEN